MSRITEIKKFACGLFSALLVVAHSTPLFAAMEGEQGKAEDYTEWFDESSAVKEEDLGEMRGGFISAGGLEINFGFFAQTIVNGELQDSISLSNISSGAAINPADLISIVQIGDGNTLPANIAGGDIGAITNIIQNTLDNQVIQFSSFMNVDVKNMDLYMDQIRTTLMNHQAIGAL